MGAVVLTALIVATSGTAASGTFKPFTLKALDGGSVALRDMLGKATLVVFFFPSCPYCNAELPEIQRLYDAYKADGLAMVWINVLPEQDDKVAEWRSRHGFTVPILLGSKSTLVDYQVRTTPSHY